MPAQYLKLSERFRIKSRQILSLEKRIDELENRHSSDDELICIINRQWNQVSYFVEYSTITYPTLAGRHSGRPHKTFCRRRQHERDGYRLIYRKLSNFPYLVNNTRSETNWLTVVSQLNNDEIAQRLESRTSSSKDVLTLLLKAMNSHSQKRDRIMTLLDPSFKSNSK